MAALRFCLPSLLLLSAAHAVDFEKDIRPLLKERCAECHGAKKQKGGLRLDFKSFAMKGGDNGPVFAAGDAEHSELWKRVTSTDDDERMPPKGAALTKPQIAWVREWINSGAPWPETQADREAATDQRLRHWSFQPVTQPAVPSVNGGLIRNPIDAFILAKLKDKNLSPSPEADRRTLIRRLSFDLLGLPPTPKEVEAFLKDSGPLAYEKLVDRLLDSPHYGERWARHWLDIAHYADTHGFERDQLRPNAWRYRDYVIDALNADKPYDHFIREQIAGDVLKPESKEAVIATGFLAAGPWDFVGQVETKSPTLNRAARAGDLDDMVTQVMTTTMGLTINCARCHDHKLDPITQEEYYRLWSVFAGVKRGERPVSGTEAQRLVGERARLGERLREVSLEVARLSGEPLDLADMVGGGNGRGTGKKGAGIVLATGQSNEGKLGYHRDLPVNRYTRTKLTAAKDKPHFIHGVFIPNGRDRVVIADGIILNQVPPSSGHAWDAVRNGLLNSQVHARAGAVDYASAGHSILGLHANGAVTFDLAEIRRVHQLKELNFTAVVACGAGDSARKSLVNFSVYVDGALSMQRLKMHKDASALVDLALPATAHHLTLMATDGGDGIGHDLLFLGDAQVRARAQASLLTEADRARLTNLEEESKRLRQSLTAVPEAAKLYGIVTEPPPVIRVQRRGNPEDAQQEVFPGGIACVKHQLADFGTQATAEGERRAALAKWITDAGNPLTRRVLVNRLWHHHFGQGLVNTPSDFGLGGDRPSHPELLDWLAGEFLRSGWSIKAMHRLICNSATYRQVSAGSPEASRTDASNRLLWRQNSRRVDAESLRDAVLAVSGNLNFARGGPGFRDFDYTEAYAPIYRYITADKPELWRRSIYRFVVRTTPHQFLTTLDCPDPANFTPARVVTTTALQALTLSNNAFMLQQADYLAKGIGHESTSVEAQVIGAFELAFQRRPNNNELHAATTLTETQGLFALCRMLINANEFVYID
ncbi:MAG: DUF1549 domain-containing protein [Prosthecobacter sp.]|nr:DUF1549 domain-containing protein [Prosthecobacter sp.]